MIEPFIKCVCFTAVDIMGHQILFVQSFKQSIFEEHGRTSLIIDKMYTVYNWIILSKVVLGVTGLVYVVALKPE